MEETARNVVEHTADIVASFVAQNRVSPEALPDLIKSIYEALVSLGSDPVQAPANPQLPAVPVRKSITPDFLISLEDGKRYKTLKRHLRTAYNMTPEDYRAKWGLPKDYPMVAANYAASRSELAKNMGLGRSGRVASEPAPKARAIRTPKA